MGCKKRHTEIEVGYLLTNILEVLSQGEGELVGGGRGGHCLFEIRYPLPTAILAFRHGPPLSFLWAPPFFEGHRPIANYLPK